MKVAATAFVPAILAACASAVPADDSAPLQAFVAANYDVTTFESAAVDLNGDGSDEHVVLLTEPGRCGTGGCTMLVLQRTPDGFQEIGRSPTTQGPVRLSPESRNGWQILLTVERYDAATHYHALHVYEDGEYREQVTDTRIDWDEPLDQDVLIAR
ncbi:hypothetical protein [Aurantiacibacter gangjinensis]|uniref:hypothetical protein n=1 Tax=Aurantiacibacter gangjinensis TaxID=502682 RepID=UPI00069B3CB9|nr:hypothetical protein [Aurantiacibacter gangjinensis]APE28397.1 hypothetical protein BMF35_a1568 [Aurantiacibacter gangjinensis]